ncbi:hypothetical protein E2C01_035558 [Portunus trituberculatus]|uniref:Uncharacterized protein n=1 Tax=Portunus trituberculatus TaxID=210409 RepID=A0A5B7FA30_PORTR|nr:hypothetical protein [Portunus trituberculatus]
MWEDETVEDVVLECEKYERERREMMQVILTELGHNRDERVAKTGRVANPKAWLWSNPKPPIAIKIKIKIKISSIVLI